MKLPYGTSDFYKIITKQYFYCDRTDRIPLLEQNDFQLFLRPRRFGKSLLLSMLENYYDVAKKDQFQTLFGKLKIGKKPTPLQNSFFILKWDFSCINASGTATDIQQSLYNHINDCIKAFILYYKAYDIPEITINPKDALSSIKSLTSSMRMMDLPIYLLVDEYDNFANEVMMAADRKTERYDSLVQKDGILKTIFKTVKSSTSNSIFDRMFITGVSPVVMSDLTSGYNIGKSIYLKPHYNDLCGFTSQEMIDAVHVVATACDAKPDKEQELIDLMQIYYNGYCFSEDAATKVYNPTLALYFLDEFQESCRTPKNMFDDNLAMDEAKLIYISGIKGGPQLIIDLMKAEAEVAIPEISRKFGIRRMLSDSSHDRAFLASFLYYFGILTIVGHTPGGKLNLKVPNLLMGRLYVERLHEMFIPEPVQRDAGKDAAEKLYSNGEMAPLCTMVEQTFFKVFRNRDYRWANELTVKTAFLTLLYNDLLFIMDSEKEIDRRFADLTMIIRPDMRRFQLFDILIEFKYVSLPDAKLTGEEAGKLSSAELANLNRIGCAMKEAKKQVKAYSNTLKKRYPELRLKSFVVVALGFERLCWMEV